ncbi:hypothetical protein [Streptomyces odontomachi]|uniref:hypothetical protein n=1 Tax=Streptomyces odontomachi TaxID=2944940 RepID=UPI00210BD463|nr:hypothetical protein [Streptomyces sp. ODS25]
MTKLLKGRHARAFATTVALSVAATGAMFTASPAANATATTCSQSNTSSVNGEGAAYLTANRNLKDGFYGDCYNIEPLSSGTYVYLRCFTENSYGNVWWYVRPQGSTVPGWLSEADLDLRYLDDNGDGQMTWLSCY